jgi:hypothetical protein
MRHKNHGYYSHAIDEDAPKVLGHDSILKWAVVATERRTPWLGGYLRNGEKKCTVGIKYILHRNSTGGGKQLLIYLLLDRR